MSIHAVRYSAFLLYMYMETHMHSTLAIKVRVNMENNIYMYNMHNSHTYGKYMYSAAMA